MRGIAVCAGLIAVLLGGCSFLTRANSSREVVITQATPAGDISFDVVKVDDAVVRTVLAHAPLPFHRRFKSYEPPPAARIAVGDVISVAIWEASADGLFGYSLREPANPHGAPFGIASAAAGNIAVPLARGAYTQPNTAMPSGIAQRLPADIAAMTSGAGQGALPGPPAAGLSATSFPASASAALPSPGFGLGAAPPPSLPGSPRDPRQVARSGTEIPIQEVGLDGAITVPYAGRIPVVGRTPNEVERMIDDRLAGKAVEPQALVAVLRSPDNSVTVAGEAVAGKRLPLDPGGERLLDVIAAAGGAQAPVHDTFLALSRDGVTATVPLARLVDHPEENIFARPGDVVTLEQRPRTFSVFGATGKNAAITFTRDRLSLSEALAQSGGLLDDKADPRAVFLLRYEAVPVIRALGQPVATAAPEGLSPIAYRFDLGDPKSYLLAKEFPVRDKDVVFVANAEIQPVYRFFAALQNVTGPVVTGFLVCKHDNC